MKTETLQALGLTQEQIDKVMAENGQDIQNVRTQLDGAVSERDEARRQLGEVQEKLTGFEGVDVEKLQGEIIKLTGDLQAKDSVYQADIAKRDREAATAAFIAGLPQKFLNEYTAGHFAEQINAALADPKNEGKSRADILAELTKGEDGKLRPGIFEAPPNPNQVLNMPPVGDVEGSGTPGAPVSLGEAQAKLNEHRITK